MSVTKHGYLNIVIALLIIVCMVLLFKPCFFAGEDSASIMSYIWMPEHHKEVGASLTETDPDFTLNGSVLLPILVMALGFVTPVLMLIKRNKTSILILGILFSLIGIISCLTNPLMKMSGMSVIFIVLMIAVLALCLYNGQWSLGKKGEEEWASDSHANEKLRAIEKAAAKKNVEMLTAYSKETDPKVCAAALEALGNTGLSDAFQPLVASLSRSHPDVRIAAAKALGELGDLRGRTYLLHFMETDPDSRVRSAMKTALAKLPTHEA